MKSVGPIVCAQGTNVIERNVQMRLFQPCHKQVKRKLLGSYHGMMTTAQRCVFEKTFLVGTGLSNANFFWAKTLSLYGPLNF